MMTSEQSRETLAERQSPIYLELEDVEDRPNSEQGPAPKAPLPANPPLYEELTPATQRTHENVYVQPQTRPEVQNSLKCRQSVLLVCTAMVTALVVTSIAVLVFVFSSLTACKEKAANPGEFRHTRIA